MEALGDCPRFPLPQLIKGTVVSLLVRSFGNVKRAADFGRNRPTWVDFSKSTTLLMSSTDR